MTPASADLDAILCAGYREEAELYGQALVLTRQNGDAWLPDLLALFGRIAAIEVRLAAAKRAWQQTGLASPGLQDCIRQVARLIATLQAAVERTIGDVETRQRALVPELDGLAHRQRMREAYERTNRQQTDN